MKERPILEYALHPADGSRVTPEAYLNEYGNLPPGVRPAVRCPVCHEDVRIARLHDRAQTRHFVHASGMEALCPLVNHGMPDAVPVMQRAPDAARERRHRDDFLAHWRLHLQAMREVAPEFSVLRFTRAIEHADVLRLWACPTLAQADVPYILLVLSAFIAAVPGPPYRAWLRFWFDASVKEVADLRAPRDMPARLFRLRYRGTQAAMFPDARHLIEWAEVPMAADFLNQATPRFLSSEVFAFEAFARQNRLRAANEEKLTPRSE
ncbi:hypothetical protein WKR88_20850 [Trinickia caryophylli]|uniref:Uncharacterized protein n=1 Tax=Trinickia caryophylli TaxID=28094 RepID=A0A1X7DPZ6_TRICW|nr:hypothetical protein [Trinickia caryophylli]PMS10593.1 hypothetical protein C0Z17_18345 [Trinickia caryophylli]TRX17233.1 hypothetical protein FNF07_02605 [Trinickia caryophylli]WQE12033.1 hypothetical protein U0034_00960 [Trinickia caryophylli]SMF19097.1 hypothetical protein SAMN06295900_103483 [Trinickia caryophylli]GLU31846.1 hypothetical protein Busp01_16880 [Trinickia caryophylli]